jgi:hypothetical protein
MYSIYYALLMAGTALLGPSCAEVAPGIQPTGQAAGEKRAQPPAAGEARAADELLSELEQSGENLVSLTAGLKWDRTFEIQGDRQIRTGKLYFVGGTPDPSRPGRKVGRKFAIHFDRLWMDNSRRDDDQVYIFDGEWLTQKITADKLILRRQIVAPGETFDPLRIGEGPMPIPIGQPKADILARYTAELLSPAEGLDPGTDADPLAKQQAAEMLKAAKDTQQLKLIPRPERAQQDDFTEIRLWYVRGKNGDLLPRMARTVNKSGDVSVVMLINVEMQLAGGPENPKAAIPSEVFNTKAPEGWIVDTQDMRQRAEETR